MQNETPVLGIWQRIAQGLLQVHTTVFSCKKAMNKWQGFMISYFRCFLVQVQLHRWSFHLHKKINIQLFDTFYKVFDFYGLCKTNLFLEVCIPKGPSYRCELGHRYWAIFPSDEYTFNSIGRYFNSSNRRSWWQKVRVARSELWRILFWLARQYLRVFSTFHEDLRHR